MVQPKPINWQKGKPKPKLKPGSARVEKPSEPFPQNQRAIDKNLFQIWSQIY